MRFYIFNRLLASPNENTNLREIPLVFLFLLEFRNFHTYEENGPGLNTPSQQCLFVCKLCLDKWKLVSLPALNLAHVTGVWKERKGSFRRERNARARPRPYESVYPCNPAKFWNPDPNSDQKMSFQTWPLKNPYPLSDLIFRQKWCLSFLLFFEFAYFLVLIHLILKRPELTHCRSFLENLTLFQTKLGKVYSRFQPK